MDQDEVRQKCERLGWKLKNKKQTWFELFESKKGLLCWECQDETGIISNIFEKRLCYECRKLSKYKSICKSTAKKEYKLTENELGNLKSYERDNPHYKCSAPMILYKLDDIKQIFCEKHNIQNTDSNVTEVLTRIAELKNQLQRKSPKENRKEKLIIALAIKGLKLRADSSLCENYISNGRDDIDYVVERMCQMKYLFEYHDFHKYLDEAHKEHRNMRKEGYYPDCSPFDDAEEKLLDDIGGYPDVFPWLVDMNNRNNRNNRNNDNVNDVDEAGWVEIEENKIDDYYIYGRNANNTLDSSNIPKTKSSKSNDDNSGDTKIVIKKKIVAPRNGRKRKVIARKAI